MGSMLGVNKAWPTYLDSYVQVMRLWRREAEDHQPANNRTICVITPMHLFEHCHILFTESTRQVFSTDEERMTHRRMMTRKSSDPNLSFSSGEQQSTIGLVALFLMQPLLLVNLIRGCFSCLLDLQKDECRVLLRTWWILGTYTRLMPQIQTYSSP
jgi:hypothetical protein